MGVRYTATNTRSLNQIANYKGKVIKADLPATAVPLLPEPARTAALRRSFEATRKA